MARLLPADAAPPANPTAARLEALLASLPDEWTLIPDRRIGGEDGPCVGFILLHLDIGIALVDLAPAQPEAGIGPLASLLGEQGLDARDLPVVAVAIAPDEIETVGERLAAAFDAAPLCTIEDRYWPERVSGLLLAAEDAAMAPIRRPAAEAVADWLPRVDSEDTIDARPSPSRHLRLSLAVAVAAVTLAGLGLGAAIDRLTRPSPSHDTAAIEVAPQPQTPDPVQTPPRAARRSSPLSPPPAAKEAPSIAAPSPPPPKPVAEPSSPPQQPEPPPPLLPPSKPVVAEAPSPPSPASAANPETGAALPAAPAKGESIRSITVNTTHKPLKKLASKSPNPQKSTVPPSPPAVQSDGPPLDAADLPPLEGAPELPPPEPARQVVSLPSGTSVPLPAPYGGSPAPGQPVMLLPPVAPPAAMPPPPALGTGR